MRIRSLVLAIALLAIAGTAGAQEMMTAPDDSGCQTFAPYTWIDVAPGATWRATVDLSKCTSDGFGWYNYYGFIMRPGGADTLLVKDGITLKTQCQTTGEVSTCNSAGRIAANVYVQVGSPTQFVLTAENTGRKTQTIRLVWLKLSYR